ncbi:ABC transporter permease [Vibrio penaeicida]|uniref:Iron ABC transporter permease n=1 Tax=Vibrio penaeicida TaxID=104609 RepID=A0AAV5NWP3_9VIBR|nr:iron ABC transporter permease [Vibrio penaeicida]RTZ20556.1 iron ABC transporter permease [Vibrio penaeicida]GLQ74674.1 iron ABC transporter permease [Vibrio penaeicida]
MQLQNRRLYATVAAAVLSFLILPWYRQEEGFYSFYWISSVFSNEESSPGMVQLLAYGKHWLIFVPIVILLSVVAACSAVSSNRRTSLLIYGSLAGFTLLTLQGFAISWNGWSWTFLSAVLPEVPGQNPFGAGAVSFGLCMVGLFSFGLAERGVMKGDAFVIGAISFLVVMVATFVLYPVLSMFAGSVQTLDGTFNPGGLARNLFHENVWSLACVVSDSRCGVAIRTLGLAISTATACTLLGLCFALVVTRTSFKYKKTLRIATILPIITPPFVIGMALILLFGRSGIITESLSDLFGIEPSRWLFSMKGIWLAQVLSFTPISFMIMIGVVEGVSPSLEEASQTLRANSAQTFWNVSLPLMRPGIANAFLVSFIESMADFGNPLVLSGSNGVLSTEIFFAVVGAQSDPTRAASLALVLLCFTLTAFMIQRLWLSGKNYATVTGKADSGVHARLPKPAERATVTIVLTWMSVTVVVYGMILFGGFVNVWGLDHSFTLKHYAHAFSIEFLETGIEWTGVAWDSFWTTMEISLISAPLTAAVGLLTAYLIVRQHFKGRSIFEFSLMMSFAIPGTVIGVSYVMAFNYPPLEMTGTALILILGFVFRNMPVGVRGGIAAMSQLDQSLDEASQTLGATTWRTLRKVILPLLRPAILSAMVFSFVRAITSISAVIFLVSAEWNMATAYIVGLVENGDFGVAIAYSSALIVVMVIVISIFQLLIGERKLRRHNRLATKKATS